jgi:hypothetical protein
VAAYSINVSVHLVTERLRTSRVGGMVRAAELLHTHREALAPFLEQDPRGKQLPSYLLALAQQLVEEQQSLLVEQRTLTDALDHVKSIIGMQQEHARVSAPMEMVRVGNLIDDALRLHAVSFQRSGIDIQREYETLPPILLDRHKLLQILLNLLSNARHALLDGERAHKRITIRLKAMPEDRVRIQVADTGQGITAECFVGLSALSHSPGVAGAVLTPTPEDKSTALQNTSSPRWKDSSCPCSRSSPAVDPASVARCRCRSSPAVCSPPVWLPPPPLPR